MKRISKIIIGSIIVFLIVITTIMASLVILKDEAVKNYLTISKLNAKVFSKELNQDINNIEKTMINVSSIIDLHTNDQKINDKLADSLQNYPQIRSINVLQNDKIIYSSNHDNLKILVKNIDLFPEAIFDDEILKISKPWIGRDFVSGNQISTYQKKINYKESSFIPISKKIISKRGEYNVIVNLNSDYFINRFQNYIKDNNIIFELIRLDGILLLSTEKLKIVGKIHEMKNLLERTIENNQITDIEIIDGKKYIVTHIITDNYPISLVVRLDYEKNLLTWNKKQYNFFIITTIIVIISILIALIFFFLYNKKREEEIKWQKLQVQEHEKFKILFQNSYFLSTIMNSLGEIVEMNIPALNFIGETQESVKGKNFWELECWPEENRSKIKKLIKNYTSDRLEYEFCAINKDKKEKIIDFSLSSVEFEDEKILLAMGLDITKRKEGEKKLKQAYTVFSNTRDGIIITDHTTKLIDVNQAFEKITGYKKDEVINKKINILKSKIHSEDFHKNIWDCILIDGYWEGEITNINKSGKEYTEWLTINTIFDEKGEIINYIGVFSDITEQKLKEKLMSENNKLLYQQSKMASMGEMIENIAHQWRQPLSAISSSATGILLQKELNLSTEENEKESLTVINEYSQYLSKTIDDFRNYLKHDTKLYLFKVSEAIEKAISHSGIKVNSNEINLVLDLKDIEICGIKNEFIQVLINIINNAKDELKGKKIISKNIFIEAYKENKHVYIKIKDNAGGVPPLIIDRIFEPYFTTKHQSIGTGIGLYMSEEIIKNHMNGILSVKNEKYIYENVEYTGACFIIDVPQ